MIGLKTSFPDDFFEEENRDGYLVTRERKEIWAVQLDLLGELLRVCSKYDISIFTDAGTTLGAMRHKGFIPWDDDIDMIMFRDEYKRLCDIADKEFKAPYFFQTEYSDPGSMRGHAQLRNSNTTGILKVEQTLNCSFNQGIFIDIFPMDNVPDDYKERRRFVKEVLIKRKIARGFARVSTRYVKSEKNAKGLIMDLLHWGLGKKAKKNLFYDKYEKGMQKYNEHPTVFVGNMFLRDIHEKYIWETKWFNNSILMPFEFMQVPVPQGYDEVLTKQYGDWRTPSVSPTMHGGVLFDTDNSYTKYLR